MTPDFQSEGVTLYLGDCMDLMRETPDKTFDLAIVDPPYGIGVNHNMGRRAGDKRSDYKAAKWDATPPQREVFPRSASRVETGDHLGRKPLH